MASKILEFVERHPYETGAAVIVVGLGVLYLIGGLGGGNAASSAAASQSASDAATASAYYNAESAQNQAGDAVQIAGIDAQASTTQALASDASQADINSTWASADLAMNQANDTTSVSLAPYAVQSQVVSALGTAAQAPNITTTNTSNNSGFFGIGGGSSTTTTVSPNPVAVSAVDQLQGLINGFHAGNG